MVAGAYALSTSAGQPHFVLYLHASGYGCLSLAETHPCPSREELDLQGSRLLGSSQCRGRDWCPLWPLRLYFEYLSRTAALVIAWRIIGLVVMAFAHIHRLRSVWQPPCVRDRNGYRPSRLRPAGVWMYGPGWRQRPDIHILFPIMYKMPGLILLSVPVLVCVIFRLFWLAGCWRL